MGDACGGEEDDEDAGDEDGAVDVEAGGDASSEYATDGDSRVGNIADEDALGCVVEDRDAVSEDTELVRKIKRSR